MLDLPFTGLVITVRFLGQIPKVGLDLPRLDTIQDHEHLRAVHPFIIVAAICLWYSCYKSPCACLHLHNTVIIFCFFHYAHLSRLRGALRMILSTLRRSYLALVLWANIGLRILTSAASEADETTAFFNL